MRTFAYLERSLLFLVQRGRFQVAVAVLGVGAELLKESKCTSCEGEALNWGRVWEVGMATCCREWRPAKANALGQIGIRN